MSNVKEGKDVKNKGDLQNLITSVILRQTSEFSVDDIYNGTRARMLGSEYYDSPEVKNYCKETLDTLYNNDCLKRVEKGKYQLAMGWPAVTMIKKNV